MQKLANNCVFNFNSIIMSKWEVKSSDGWWEDIRKFLTFLREGGLNDDAVDVPQVGDLLECVIFGIVFQELIEGVSNKQCVFEFGQLSQLVELVPTLDFVV